VGITAHGRLLDYPLALFRSACFSAFAKTYSFAVFGVALAEANCKCVWLLALDLFSNVTYSL